MESNKNSSNNLKRDRDASTTASQNNSMNSFLASMTFAGTGSHKQRGGCDCDECEGANGLLPQQIIEAIRNHKRQKAQSGPMKRTQQRQLVARDVPSQISVYQVTMPLESEPLVEFGTSHRLVWIRHLGVHSKLLSIGKGIVGSQDEERGRQELKDWKQGQVFVLPSNGGKAVAWIHASTAATSSSAASEKVEEESTKEPTREEEKKESPKEDEAENQAQPSLGGHAVLYVCKIPTTALSQPTTNKESGSAEQEWHEMLRETCKVAVDSFENENLENDKGLQYQRLPEDKATRLCQMLSNL